MDTGNLESTFVASTTGDVFSGRMQMRIKLDTTSGDFLSGRPFVNIESGQFVFRGSSADLAIPDQVLVLGSVVGAAYPDIELQTFASFFLIRPSYVHPKAKSLIASGINTQGKEAR